MMQTIYYNFDRKYLCDASGTAIPDLPEIAFAEKPTWRIIPVNDAGNIIIPNGINAFRAAVAFDFSSASGVAIRALNDSISGSSSGIDIQLNANTAEFLTAVDGQETRTAYFELAGFDSNANRVFYLSFRCLARMILDVDSNSPEELDSDSLDRVTAAALLAEKADLTTVTALTSRVSALESAVGTFESQAEAIIGEGSNT